MEKTVHFEPQEQVSKVVTPDKGEVGKVPTQGKRSNRPRIIQPRAKITKTEPEERSLKSKWYLPEQRKWFKHLDKKWIRTVWWCDQEQAWKPRDPTKPIVWASSPDWKPETVEEAEERRKKGCRLEHNEVKVGGIHQFFDNPDRKVRVKRIHNATLEVYLIKLDGSGGEYVLQTSWRVRSSTPSELGRIGLDVGQRGVWPGANIIINLFFLVLFQGQGGGSILFCRLGSKILI